jgi:alpha-ribazole phosphatase
LLCGPALRCRQTAEILFPGVPYEICQLTEIDFGIFKGKNAEELLGDGDYERWLETDCMGDIPGGDSVSGYKKYCCDTFKSIAESLGDGTTALVIHGGNIMSIMEGLALPKKDFYAYHIPNCGYVCCRYEDGALYAGDGNT